MERARKLYQSPARLDLDANCVTNDNKLFFRWVLHCKSDGFKGAMWSLITQVLTFFDKILMQIEFFCVKITTP